MPPAILWGSPLPPARTGVSDYAVELLPHLAARTRVRVLAPPGHDIDAPVLESAGIEVVESSTSAEGDELSLIHLGNNPHHLWLLPRLAAPRTVVVLHDTVLHHLLVESTVARGDLEGYRRRIEAAAPGAGDRLARAREAGYGGRLDPFLFPARTCFLERASAVVVHSARALKEVESDHLGVPVIQVGLSAAEPPHVARAEMRRILGLPADAVVLMHLGFLTADKGIGDILAGVAAARSAGVPAHLAVLGEGRLGDHLQRGVSGLGIAEHVTFAGWVDDETLRAAPAAADLGVVLRAPSAGETSAAVVRFLAAGTPVAVTGRRQFLEWPEMATPRLTPGPGTAAELARLLVDVAFGGPGWGERRAAARATYDRRHRPEHAADQLLRGLTRVSGAWTG